MAWLGVVPFHMSGIRMRGCPAVPTTGAFAELNVRTYVTDGVKRGVWFFSLDAESRLAVAVARRVWHLNYHRARMRWRREGEAVEYESKRVNGAAEFVARYWPVGEEFRGAAGSLEEFLTERYWMFAEDRRGRLYRGEVLHERWKLRRAEAEITRNTMAGAIGVELPDAGLHLLIGECGEVLVRRMEKA